MRRDKDAIEAAVVFPTSLTDHHLQRFATKVDRYLAHLAEHGDDEGRKWKLVPVDAAKETLEIAVATLRSLYGDATVSGDPVHHESVARAVWFHIMLEAPSVTG